MHASLVLDIRGRLVSTGDFPNPVHNQNFFAKVDHHFSDADQFSARYSLYHVDSINSRGAGGLERAHGVSESFRHRSDDRGEQHPDALTPNGE